MWRRSSLRSFGGIAFSRPPKNMFKNSVSTMSSRWWPSAILVIPFSDAKRYSAPRRSREHNPQRVLPSGMMRFTTE